jgi:hypothetical protein
MNNRLVVCLVLPLVIWGAGKLDTDLASACFFSSFFYVIWAVVMTIKEAHEQTDIDKQQRDHRFQKELWLHQREQSPPPPKEWHESSEGGNYRKF